MRLNNTFVALLTGALFASTALGAPLDDGALSVRGDAPESNLQVRGEDDLVDALCSCQGSDCKKIRRQLYELERRGKEINVNIDDTQQGGDDDSLKTRYMMTCIGVGIRGKKSDDSPDDAPTKILSHIKGRKDLAEPQIKKIEGILEKAKLKDIKWVMAVPDLDKDKFPSSPTGMPPFGQKNVDEVQGAIDEIQERVKKATGESPKKIVKRDMRKMQPTVKSPYGEMEIEKDGKMTVEGEEALDD